MPIKLPILLLAPTALYQYTSSQLDPVNSSCNIDGPLHTTDIVTGERLDVKLPSNSCDGPLGRSNQYCGGHLTI